MARKVRASNVVFLRGTHTTLWVVGGIDGLRGWAMATFPFRRTPQSSIRHPGNTPSPISIIRF